MGEAAGQDGRGFLVKVFRFIKFMFLDKQAKRGQLDHISRPIACSHA